MSLKVAIYSGIVPSTTFIENLIKSLRKEEIVIHIYGRKKTSCKYHGKNIRLFLIPENRVFRLIFFIRNFLIALVTITTIVSSLIYITIWLKAVGSE